MSQFPLTPKTEITRLAKRGTYDKAVIHSVLDEALFCTVAYVHEGQAFQIPTGFCRMGDTVYIHGSVGSHYMRMLTGGIPVCISATLIDGLVLARSAFHHSVNYRSVVFFGRGRKVAEETELYSALEVFTNKMCPGRWADIRHPHAGEWKATMVIAFEIDEASAKIRTGPPVDDEQDYQLDTWAGVQPLRMVRDNAQPDPALKAGVGLPKYLQS